MSRRNDRIEPEITNPEYVLTPYEEFGRRPHTPITDETMVTLKWNELNDQMKCPVCLSVLTDTMTTKDCLHRFCNGCITQSLRKTKKNCPTCRKECPSKRSLRNDEKFDSLIKIIFPDRKVLEDAHELLMKKIHDTNNAKAAMQMYNTGTLVQGQAAHAKRAPKQHVRSYSESSDHHRSSSSSSHHRERDDSGSSGPAVKKRRKSNDSDSGGARAYGSGPGPRSHAPMSAALSKVELVFLPHPQDAANIKELRHKYLTTTPDCTLAHLAKYLLLRLKADGRDSAHGVDNPAFYTQGYNGYRRWRNHEMLRTVMEWRIRDQIAQVNLKAPFTIYYASSAKAKLESSRVS